MTIETCTLRTFNTISDSRGCLTFMETGGSVPFDIKRIFYLHDVPKEASRGAHAHRTCLQLMIPLHGSCDVTADNGEEKKSFALKRRNEGLLVEPVTWCEISNFSTDAVLVVLASASYDESDYIRDYDDFLNIVNSSKKG